MSQEDFSNNFEENNNYCGEEDEESESEQSTLISSHEKNTIDILKFPDLSQKIINNRKNFIIISEDSSIIQETVNELNKNSNNKNKNKICILTSDNKKASKIYEQLGSKDYISILQGNKGKKSKNDFESFQESIKGKTILIILPNVLYKYLTIGFLKIFYFDVLIFDDCHLCNSNHPYNTIMLEFYFFYYTIKPDKIKNLPQILGFTDSPFKDKNILKNPKKCNELLKNISENLNCEIFVDPELLKKSNGKEIKPDFIQIENHLENPKQKSKCEGIFLILEHFFFNDMLELCINNFMRLNTKNPLKLDEVKEIKKKYSESLYNKFHSKNYEEYNNFETAERSLHFLSQDGSLFKIFEDIQKHLITIIQNIDNEEIYIMFKQYYELYNQNFLNPKNEIDTKLLSEYQKMINIFKTNMNAFKRLIDIKALYQNDRALKLVKTLNEIYKNNSIAKILIFVPTRKLAYIINNYLSRNKNFSGKINYLVGLNGKREENISLTVSTRLTQVGINKRIEDYNKDKIKILICTPPANDFLSINKCDYLVIFSELSNSNNDYEKVRTRAMKLNSKLIIFGDDKMQELLAEKKNKENDQLRIFFPNEKDNFKDFKSKSFLNTKKQNINFYLYIKETEAKMTLKNCTLLFNEINNAYTSNGIKLRFEKEIRSLSSKNKAKKYMCLMRFYDKFEGFNVNSHECNDKQTAENQCLMFFIQYLKKINAIDNHFRLII